MEEIYFGRVRFRMKKRGNREGALLGSSLWKQARRQFGRRVVAGILCAAVAAGNMTSLQGLQTAYAQEERQAETAAANEGSAARTANTGEESKAQADRRQVEALDRGIVAFKTGGGVYLSWRFLGTDSTDTSFELYRDGQKITTDPIKASTNYLDASGTVKSSYVLHTLQGGVDTEQSKPISVWENNYLDIPLDKPAPGVTPDGKEYDYSPNDAACGDLDGDGEYEIILKWMPSNSGDNMADGYRGNVYLDAYKMNGTKLWRIHLGVNIRAGAHYTPFLVYDFDGDGYAELVCKTADGTIDGKGNVIGQAGKDWRSPAGVILEGPEYLTLFEGQTGKTLDTIDYEPGRGIHGTPGVLNKDYWGDDFGNRSERYLAAVAYLNGRTPSVLVSRGYYVNFGMTAYDIVNKKFQKRWFFDTAEEGNEKFAGQGNHNLAVADVDEDGFDEIVFGACTIDHDGSGLYSNELGHGDAIHVGDFDPESPGLEIFSCFEHEPYGAALRKASNGEIIFRYTADSDTGRAIAGNFSAENPGAEFSASLGDDLWNSKGEAIGTWSSITKWMQNFTIYWDGDLEQEVMERTMIDGYGKGRVFTARDVAYINGTKGNSSLAADLLGDWREEVIWPSQDGTFLRLYHTDFPTEYRIATLMHDTQYRVQIATQNVGYNQPAHTSFFLGTGYQLPKQPQVEAVKPKEPGNSGDSEGPGNTGKPGDSGNSGNMGNTGGSENSGNAGNTGKPEGPSSQLPETAKVSVSQLATACHAKVTFAKVSGAQEYDVYRSAKEASGYQKVGSTKTTSYTDKSVKAGKTYYYKIAAKGNGKVSDSALSRKYAKITVLARPKVSVKALKKGKVKVSWKKVKGASGYVVYTSKSKSKGYKKAAKISKAASGSKVVKSGVKKGKCYVKVRPYKMDGKKPVYGTYSKPLSVKVKK